MKNSRGVELVISSMIVIILGLVVLVMGILFTRNVMCKGIDGVNKLGEFTDSEIDRLFRTQQSNVLVKEPENEIQMGIYYGVGFVIKNEDRDSNSDFRYIVNVKDTGDCDISSQEAENYIVSGKSATINIARGDDYVERIEFNIPRSASECSLKYEIRVENQGDFYGSASFDVRIKKTVMGAIC